MKMIIINGQFTARRVTGQERFAFEIISELDKICQDGQYTLVIPKNAYNVPALKIFMLLNMVRLKARYGSRHSLLGI